MFSGRVEGVATQFLADTCAKAPSLAKNATRLFQSPLNRNFKMSPATSSWKMAAGYQPKVQSYVPLK